MKRFYQLACFYFSFFLLAILLQSCCRGDLYISDHGTVNITDLDDLLGDGIINGAFFLTVVPQLDVASTNTDFGLINTANALSCDRPILNDVLESSISITCDKEFVFEGTTIPVGTDFINSAGITTNIQNEQFELDDYTFTITYSSDDDLDFEVTGTYLIEI